MSQVSVENQLLKGRKTNQSRLDEKQGILCRAQAFFLSFSAYLAARNFVFPGLIVYKSTSLK